MEGTIEAVMSAEIGRGAARFKRFHRSLAQGLKIVSVVIIRTPSVQKYSTLFARQKPVYYAQ